MPMISFNDSNDDKIRAICNAIGVEKFIEITDVVNGQIYIPQKNKFIRKLISEDADLFLEFLNKISSLQEAAIKFRVSTRTIQNWIRTAFHAKKTQKKKGRDENADKLARALL